MCVMPSYLLPCVAQILSTALNVASTRPVVTLPLSVDVKKLCLPSTAGPTVNLPEQLIWRKCRNAICFSIIPREIIIPIANYLTLSRKDSRGVSDFCHHLPQDLLLALYVGSKMTEGDETDGLRSAIADPHIASCMLEGGRQVEIDATTVRALAIEPCVLRESDRRPGMWSSLPPSGLSIKLAQNSVILSLAHINSHQAFDLPPTRINLITSVLEPLSRAPQTNEEDLSKDCPCVPEDDRRLSMCTRRRSNSPTGTS